MNKGTSTIFDDVTTTENDRVCRHIRPAFLKALRFMGARAALHGRMEVGAYTKGILPFLQKIIDLHQIVFLILKTSPTAGNRRYITDRREESGSAQVTSMVCLFNESIHG